MTSEKIQPIGLESKSADLIEVSGTIIPGHGVASGQSAHSPYPRGSLDMQLPFFEAAGVDLRDCFLGTLNISIEPYEFELYAPAKTLRNVRWTSIIDAEDFSFSPCVLEYDNQEHSGWIYYPRPETKTIHFQPPHMIEVIMPYIKGLSSYDTVVLKVLSKEVHLRLSAEP